MDSPCHGPAIKRKDRANPSKLTELIEKELLEESTPQAGSVIDQTLTRQVESP
jgi:hypothetical protein